MHLIVPFAGVSSDAGRQALHDLPLPNLQRLMARLQPLPPDRADDMSLSPPHERALARAYGWAVDDGLLPFAAHEAAALDLLPRAPADHAWAWLTPVHLHVGTEQFTMTDPATLELDEAASRTLLEAVRPLFDSEGFTLHWAAPLRWLATHPLFEALPTASLDRVIGRNVDPWLPDQRAARLLRRLQNEVQMLLYTHPLNEQREAAGLPTVNSVWASGSGRARPAAPDSAPVVDASLRAPALAEDWVTWREAWGRLDAGPIAALARHEGPLALTLAGERAAARFERRPQGLWQRLSSTWSRAPLPALLESL